MGIVVLGAVFVDIKGYPSDVYIPGGRNAGRVEQMHGGVSRNIVEDIANVELQPTFIGLVDDTGAGADPVGGNSQRRRHRKIRHHRHGKGNASGAIRKQDPGHIRIGDQRKDQRGCSQQVIHNKVFSKRCLHSHNRFLLFDINQYNIVEWGCPWN